LTESAVGVLGLRRARCIGQRKRTAETVKQRAPPSGRIAAREDLIKSAIENIGKSALRRLFLNRVHAVMKKRRRHAVNIFTTSSSSAVVLKVRIDFGTTDCNEVISSIPGITVQAIVCQIAIEIVTECLATET
jgi:hypothetical protein